MSSSRSRWLALGLLAATVAAGGALVVQRREAEALRVELMLLRDAQVRLDAEQAERRRLVAVQAPDAEVARLRADRTALIRLRTEIEALQADAERKARLETQAAARP